MKPDVIQHDNLFRGLMGPRSLELRADDDAPAGAVMAGHFAVFDTMTEIDSWFEGRFMEQIAPGAFRKTFTENLSNVRVQFDHGYDTFVGSAPLGPIRSVVEDKVGAYYEVPLLDTDYNRNRILPLLEGRTMDGDTHGSLLGASFRFRVVKEEWDEEPKRSNANPDGIPVRTITEARLYEFGPVVFPAYAEASAGMRSLTDHYLDRVRTLRRDPAAAGTGDRQPAKPPAGHSVEQQPSRTSVASALTQLSALGGQR
jgi:HK97 family phage prohead protease